MKIIYTPTLAFAVLTALSVAACTDDGELLSDSDVESSEQSDTAVSMSTDGAAAIGSGSTAGVACDYMVNEYNAATSVLAISESTWTCSDTERELIANGIPDHDVGTFPSAANPNPISVQEISAFYTLDPVATGTRTDLGGPQGVVGHVLNGVKLDPGTGGSCNDSGDQCSGGDPSLGWNLEALGQDSFDFGDDFNNAHVQPTGQYHYHGIPEGFITKQGGDETSMTLIGWAADGFPIYARYGYTVADDATSAIQAMQGSYQLVTTVADSRPSTELYSLGTFAQDWEFVEGSGELDECNGRTGVTPEFPGGIYHYFATDSYPYLQRCVTGDIEGAGVMGPPPGADAPPQ